MGYSRACVRFVLPIFQRCRSPPSENLKIYSLFKLLEVTAMSKNQEERANYYLYIDGQAVPVSKQVYRVYQHYERKEEYFSYDLKTEKFQKDTATFLPSREDSYERLLEQDRQFAAPGKSVEQLALKHLEAERIRFCLAQLTDEERKLISLLFYQEKTEQEVGNMLHISHQAVNKRKQALLLKLRKIFEEFF